MDNDLLRSKYISELANSLYSWLPGSAPPFGKTYTFQDVANEYRLVWNEGSKLPALQSLLEQAERKATLVNVVLRIIKEGIKYRDRKNNPVKRTEVETINSILLKLGYRIPDLHDEKFLSALSPTNLSKVVVDHVELSNFREEYHKMQQNPDAQSRGYEFQSFLERLFKLWQLNPRAAYRTEHDEIDGSIELDGEVYLLEARWRSRPTDKEDLSNFYFKIENKANWTRGIFISISGFNEQALNYLTSNSILNFIAIRGGEIELILDGKVDLLDMLRKKVRVLAEEKRFYFYDNIKTT
jgi:hypothetical protein